MERPAKRIHESRLANEEMSVTTRDLDDVSRDSSEDSTSASNGTTSIGEGSIGEDLANTSDMEARYQENCPELEHRSVEVVPGLKVAVPLFSLARNRSRRAPARYHYCIIPS